MYHIIWPLLAVMMMFSASAVANPCLNYMNHSQGVCDNYRYDPITLNYRDQHGLLQEVTVHRIRNNQGTVVQADLDFKFKCLQGCSSHRDSAVNEGLWAFRAAYLTNQFYTIRYCDPLREVCCDENGCTEILADDSEAKLSNNYTVSSRRRPIEEWIPIVESGLNLYDRVVRNSRNEHELRQEIVAKQQAPMKFIMNQNNSGGYKVCVITGSSCVDIDGLTTIGDDFARIDLRHEHGPEFNTDLDRWLREWFWERPVRLQCTQSMSCDSRGNCTITMRCYTP